MLKEELKNIKCGKSDLRKFGIMIGVVLGLLGGLFFWRGKVFSPYFFILAAAFLTLGLFFPGVLKPIYKIWMSLATLMGWFMTRVILTLLFYLVVTPISLISRLAGKQFLEVKMDKSQVSYWNYREPKKFEKSNYERQF